MKLINFDAKKLKNKQGIALVIVVSVLAMLVILTVAIFSLSENERISSEQQYQHERTKELAVPSRREFTRESHRSDCVTVD